MVKDNITHLHGLEPQDLLIPLDCLKKQLEDLKRSLIDNTPAELLSRKEVALLLKTNPQTVNNWTNWKGDPETTTFKTFKFEEPSKDDPVIKQDLNYKNMVIIKRKEEWTL